MQLYRVYFWSFVVALGGLLFGFDTAVISGAEKAIQSLWHLSSVAHGFTIASGLIGTVLGAIFTAAPAQRYGRKPTLYAIALLYLLCALGCAFTDSWAIFVVSRMLGGVAVGASSVVGPMYIAELAPARLRGRLVGSFQLNVVLGILIAYVSNFLLVDAGDESWRWMLGVQAIPSLIFLVLLVFVPESPRWLLLRGHQAAAEAVFRRSGEREVAKVMAEVQQRTEPTQQDRLFDKRYRKPLSYAFLLAAFNQLTGINALLYFAPRIFELTGIGQEHAFLQSISIGLTLFVFTMVGVSIIDRFGRKTLLVVGSLGMAVFLALSGWSISLTNAGMLPMFCLIGFIIFFSFSQGAVIWVFISEIFPNSVRSQGQAFGSTTHWLGAALISFLFPIVAEDVAHGVEYSFYFFSAMMVIHCWFASKYLPETKGKTLEDIEREMSSLTH